MVGWAVEDFAGRGCCGSLVAVTFFAWSFLFVRPIVAAVWAVCGRGGRSGKEIRGRAFNRASPCHPLPCNAGCSDFFVCWGFS
jgi:hypothetical protein